MLIVPLSIQEHNEWFHKRQGDLITELEKVENKCRDKCERAVAQEKESKETLISMELSVSDTKKQLQAVEEEVSRAAKQLNELRREVQHYNVI